MTRTESGSCEIVGVAGEFDARAVPEFDRAFEGRDHTKPLIVCLNDTTLVDSSALGALIRLNTRREGALAVHRPQAFQQELFDITGLNDILASTTECTCGHA